MKLFVRTIGTVRLRETAHVRADPHSSTGHAALQPAHPSPVHPPLQTRLLEVYRRRQNSTCLYDGSALVLSELSF